MNPDPLQQAFADLALARNNLITAQKAYKLLCVKTTLAHCPIKPRQSIKANYPNTGSLMSVKGSTTQFNTDNNQWYWIAFGRLITAKGVKGRKRAKHYQKVFKD